MLDSFVGLRAMSDIICRCESIPIPWSVDHKLLHEVIGSRSLISVNFRKSHFGEGIGQPALRRRLRKIAMLAKQAHVAEFGSEAAEQRFKRAPGRVAEGAIRYGPNAC